LHNDLHTRQFVIKRRGVSLIDLDRAAIGSADVDVAQLATQLEMLANRPDFEADTSTATMWKQSFLSHWKAVAGHESDPVRFHLLAARTRLELARGMMRHMRPWWRPFAAECVARAVDDVARASSGEGVL